VLVTIRRHDRLALKQDTVVAIFGTFLAADEEDGRAGGEAIDSPVASLPARQLLAFTKVHVPPSAGVSSGGQQQVTTAVALRVNISAIPGVDRQPWPGVLKLWVGDGGGLGGTPAPHRKMATPAQTATLQLVF
jgi:hypothetical protein